MSSLARRRGGCARCPFAASNAAVILFGAAGVCGIDRENI
jgi:hypothetical protein